MKLILLMKPKTAHRLKPQNNLFLKVEVVQTTEKNQIKCFSYTYI